MFWKQDDREVGTDSWLDGWSLTWESRHFHLWCHNRLISRSHFLNEQIPPESRASKSSKESTLSHVLRVCWQARGTTLLIKWILKSTDPLSSNLHFSNRCANLLHHWLTFLNLNQHQEKQAERAGINADISRVKFGMRVVKKYYFSQFNRGALACRN